MISHGTGGICLYPLRGPTHMADNQDIRQQLRRQRAALSKKQITGASQAVAHRLISHPWLVHARIVAGYKPTAGELDPGPVLQLIERRSKTICLPVLHPYKANQLLFARCSTQDKLSQNRYGIEEPVITQKSLVYQKQIDVVLVPLVAFDENCHRLGMGGGYYDRTFSDRKNIKKWARPKLIGVAYEFQCMNILSQNHWDVTLDVVVTEEKIYRRENQ